MEDVNTPAAESSPAAQPAAPESKPAEVSVPTDAKAYAEWRQTGKLPGEKSSEEDDSAPSKSGGKPQKTAPVSETGDKGKQVRSDADGRKEELNREIRDLLAKRDALRKEAPTGKQDVKPAAKPSSAGPDEGRPQRPRQEDFDTWDAYDKAQDEYLENLADWKAGRKLEEHTQRQRQETATQEMQRRLDSANERYGAEAAESITTTAKTVFEHDSVAPAIKAAIGRSDVIVDALYVMGSDAAELDDFLDLAAKDPLEALRKWFTIEGLVKEELKSGKRGKVEDGPARGTDGKFQSGNGRPARQEAPSPPVELNGNTAPPGDERERAAKTGDFRSFKEAADRRELAARRGQ